MSARLSSPSKSESCAPAGPAPGPFSALLIAGAILAVATGTVLPRTATAQTPPAKAAEKSVPPGPSVNKAAAEKKPRASSRKKVEEPKEEPEPVVTNADEEQLLAAKEVYLGESGCEFNQKIQVDANAAHPGYVDMSFNKKKYMMKPVRSVTGALRLEDVRSETLMIQISSKTMLMNQKTGQRLLDNCVHPDQKVTAADSEQVLMK